VLISRDESKAVIESILSPPDGDTELQEFSDRMDRPVVVSTELLGKLALDRELNWFAGKATWLGATIDVRCEPDDHGNIDKALETARNLWADQQGWTNKVAAFAAKELLPIKNENWLDDGEKPLTADEFISRMHLDSIFAGGEGEFEFWHDDDDMFLGHSIQVRGNLTDGLQWANIPG
jgi:hypothetical protein